MAQDKEWRGGKLRVGTSTNTESISNSPPARRVEWIVWGGLALTIAAICAAFVVSRRDQGSATGVLPTLFPVPEFALTNQFGRTIGLADLRRHVWIADMIFTQCGGPCPQMTARMAELQRALPASSPVRFVTLTTDPDHDTPAVLRDYASRAGAESNRWHFLTGTKQQLGRLAIDGLKLIATEKRQEERENDRDLFVHSTIFIVIDQRGRVRGMIEPGGGISGGIESDRPDFTERAVSVVNQLLRERSP